MSSMNAPYGLIFEGMGKDRVLGWDGPWPPPERLWAATGAESGRTVYFDPEEVPMPMRMEAELTPSITLRYFTRRSYSELEPTSFVWPCAQYVEEGFDYDGGHLIRQEAS